MPHPPQPTISACAMASSPVIFPDGRVNACIGPILTLTHRHPMCLGNLYQENLSDILDRSESNPFLHTIRIWGPSKLISLMEEQKLEKLLPKKYISNCLCDVCYKLLSNERIILELENILNDEQIKNTIAYARIYYFNELKMAEEYNLNIID